jgi:hypothetical protein
MVLVYVITHSMNHVHGRQFLEITLREPVIRIVLLYRCFVVHPIVFQWLLGWFDHWLVWWVYKCEMSFDGTESSLNVFIYCRSRVLLVCLFLASRPFVGNSATSRIFNGCQFYYYCYCWLVHQKLTLREKTKPGRDFQSLGHLHAAVFNGASDWLILYLFWPCTTGR